MGLLIWIGGGWGFPDVTQFWVVLGVICCRVCG